MLLPLSRSVVAANVVLAVLAATAVTLRVVAKRQRKQSLKADDYVIMLALIIALGMCIEGIYSGATNIFAIPIKKLTLGQFELHEKLIWIDVLLCHLVYGIIKISILLFYKRIFTTKPFKLVANIFMGIVTAWMIAATFTHIFSATPVNKWWTGGRHFSLNFDYEIFLVAMAGIDIGLDIFTLLLPLPMVKNLHMSRKQRVSLAGLFALGFFCVISSAIRMYYCWRLHLVFSGRLSPVWITSISAWNDVWAHIEACASIVTACLPTLAPLFSGIRAPESIANGFRSFFSLKSSSFFSSKKSKSSTSKESSVRSLTGDDDSWRENHVRSESRVSHSAPNDDVEKQANHPEVIVVEKTFSRHVEEPVDV